MICTLNVADSAYASAGYVDEVAEKMRAVMGLLAEADEALIEAVGHGADEYNEYNEAEYADTVREKIAEMRKAAHTIVINAYWWVQAMPQIEERKESEDDKNGEV